MFLLPQRSMHFVAEPVLPQYNEAPLTIPPNTSYFHHFRWPWTIQLTKGTETKDLALALRPEPYGEKVKSSFEEYCFQRGATGRENCVSRHSERSSKLPISRWKPQRASFRGVTRDQLYWWPLGEPLLLSKRIPCDISIISAPDWGVPDQPSKIMRGRIGTYKMEGEMMISWSVSCIFWNLDRLMWLIHLIELLINY